MTIPASRRARYRGPQEEPLPATVSIGRYLGQSRESPPESIINAKLVRAEELKSEKPEAPLLSSTSRTSGRGGKSNSTSSDESGTVQRTQPPSSKR